MDVSEDSLAQVQKPSEKGLFAGKRRYWYIGIIVFALSILVIRTSIVDWSWIPSGSMSPTVIQGDIVLNNRMAYDIRIPLTSWRIHHADPKRGDIAIFRSPENGIGLLKRVIGIPGDTISMKDGALFINGKPIAYQPLTNERFQDLPSHFLNYAHFQQELLDENPHDIMFVSGAPSVLRNIPDIIVPEGKYFMLGDNRDFSRDSRMYGFVDRESFISRATSVLFSFRKEASYEPRVDRFFHALR
ncbi:MAG: signal peptidase I [Verrucomicrobiota bacterium]